MSIELAEETQIVSSLKDAMGEALLEAKIPHPRRIFVHLSMETFKKAVGYLSQKAAFTHISAMTGIDVGKAIEVIYHLNRDGRIELSLKVQTPKDNACLPTITDIIPGAILYEREVHDLLGVAFEGHPDLSPLVLPEGWPSGVHPLRKEWTIEEIQKEISKEGEH
jgi:membrane-bound hydrogenase subunit beta